MTFIFLSLLPWALKAADAKSKNPLHITAALVAWVLDIILAHTAWALVAGWPKKGEMTISDTLERLCKTENATHPDYLLFVEIARKVNRVSPTGAHIWSVKDI
jgi:hypothetical protein